MELYAFNPGPLDESVLYDQEKHVSSAVWEGQERGALRCHEHTSKLDQWALTEKQLELIEKAGFGYLRFIPAISLDNPLISALVERWRRETNTFHLTVGEMTVTLEDVAYLLGLAIDGEPVIGVTYTTCDAVCRKFLGKAPDSGYTSGGMVKLSWLKECFSQCPENASTEDIHRYTRAYLLYLVGSTIFSTTTGNKVPVMYLPLFEDFEQSGKYAWGAAALAFLYRALGNASLRSQSTVSGSLTLLQCWSYFHLNIGRPKLSQEAVPDQYPLVLKWKGKQSGPTSNRDLTFYRKALDALKPSDVDWFPYQNIEQMIIPENIMSSLILGKSKTMLICFDKAERHLPDRCLRQYGMRQPIPECVLRWERKSRGVDGGVDLRTKMESELVEWSERHLHIVHSDDTIDDSDYMHWYLKITRRFVGRPIPLASEFQRMTATLREVAHIADTLSLQGLDNEQIQSVTRIRYVVHECLRDQAGSVVTVASAELETENGKRGRGKEKVRRRTVGKRRRKDDLEGDGREEPFISLPASSHSDFMNIPPHPLSVSRPSDPDDEVINAELCNTSNDVTVNQIDDSQLISVSEIDDVQMLSFQDELMVSQSYPDNGVADTPIAGQRNDSCQHLDQVDEPQPSGEVDKIDYSQPSGKVDKVDHSQFSDKVDKVDDSQHSGEVDKVDDSHHLGEVDRVDDSHHLGEVDKDGPSGGVEKHDNYPPLVEVDKVDDYVPSGEVDKVDDFQPSLEVDMVYYSRPSGEVDSQPSSATHAKSEQQPSSASCEENDAPVETMEADS